MVSGAEHHVDNGLHLSLSHHGLSIPIGAVRPAGKLVTRGQGSISPGSRLEALPPLTDSSSLAVVGQEAWDYFLQQPLPSEARAPIAACVMHQHRTSECMVSASVAVVCAASLPCEDAISHPRGMPCQARMATSNIGKHGEPSATSAEPLIAHRRMRRQRGTEVQQVLDNECSASDALFWLWAAGCRP